MALAMLSTVTGGAERVLSFVIGWLVKVASPCHARVALRREVALRCWQRTHHLRRY